MLVAINTFACHPPPFSSPQPPQPFTNLHSPALPSHPPPLHSLWVDGPPSLPPGMHDARALGGVSGQVRVFSLVSLWLFSGFPLVSFICLVVPCGCTAQPQCKTETETPGGQRHGYLGVSPGTGKGPTGVHHTAAPGWRPSVRFSWEWLRGEPPSSWELQRCIGCHRIWGTTGNAATCRSSEQHSDTALESKKQPARALPCPSSQIVQQSWLFMCSAKLNGHVNGYRGSHPYLPGGYHSLRMSGGSKLTSARSLPGE